MSQLTAASLGAIAGFTIFIGLPVARVRGLPRPVQGFLNALATGVLVFLLWDILAHAGAPVESALKHTGSAGFGRFAGLAAVFAAGLGVGLLSLIYFNGALSRRVRGPEHAGGAPPTPQALGMMIATGLGLHNFSEGLAIGASAQKGEIALALTLVVGFGLHNLTEAFGIAAPLVGQRASWGLLATAGLIAGGPNFLGTVIGYGFSSPLLSVLFLALAGGALVFVLGELFASGRKLTEPLWNGWGIGFGFVAGLLTDLILVAAGG